MLCSLQTANYPGTGTRKILKKKIFFTHLNFSFLDIVIFAVIVVASRISLPDKWRVFSAAEEIFHKTKQCPSRLPAA
uniref:Uncharacterized protein n=1 Tax=Anguilla anguilla TaxID=7936 RepID=A0A0E9XTW1_ANGAN